MKLLKLIGVIVLFCYSTLNAQELIELTSKKEFEEKGHNHISSAVLTTDGYHVVTGYTQNNSKGGKDIWVAKLSITGELIWQKTFGDINNDEGTAIVEALDGDYAVVGQSTQHPDILKVGF